MTLALARRSYVRPLGFAVLITLVAAAALAVADHLPAASRPDALALALTIDLVILVPLAYYVLLVRGQGWPGATTGAVLLGCIYAAHLIVPDAYDGPVQVVTYLIVPVELFLLGYVLTRAVRSVRRVRRRSGDVATGDLLDHLRVALRAAVAVRRPADAIAYEIAVLYYALFAWRTDPTAIQRQQGAFPYHRSSGYGAIFGAILMAVVAEVVAFHILLSLWSPVAAWVHTGLVVYGTLFLIGDYRAMRFRPIVVTDEAVHVRCGLRWTAKIPRTGIAGVEPMRREIEEHDGYFSAAAAPKPDLVLNLRAPVVIGGPYGMTRTADCIGISADDVQGLVEAVRDASPTGLPPAPATGRAGC